jgi:hypothetical protein
MKHRDDPAGQGDADDRHTPNPETRPDFARGGLERPERMAEVGEDPEPNFATKDIDPAAAGPIAPGKPSYATTDIDPAAADPIPPGGHDYSTKDQNLG